MNLVSVDELHLPLLRVTLQLEWLKAGINRFPEYLPDLTTCLRRVYLDCDGRKPDTQWLQIKGFLAPFDAVMRKWQNRSPVDTYTLHGKTGQMVHSKDQAQFFADAQALIEAIKTLGPATSVQELDNWVTILVAGCDACRASHSMQPRRLAA